MFYQKLKKKICYQKNCKCLTKFPVIYMLYSCLKLSMASLPQLAVSILYISSLLASVESLPQYYKKTTIITPQLYVGKNSTMFIEYCHYNFGSKNCQVYKCKLGKLLQQLQLQRLSQNAYTNSSSKSE